MLNSIDQMGNELKLGAQPESIISLVPSITELLFSLGLEGKIVGRTKFCKHPKNKIKQIPIVGGTKKFRFKVIEEIKPDLIIGNKEENYKDGILQLMEKHPVWMSDINSYADSIDMIHKLGSICGVMDKAQKIIDEIENEFAKLKNNTSKPSVLYLIWQNPYIAVGTNNFIHDILSKAGFDNCCAQPRYVEMNINNIAELNPDVILLSSEPFPFKQRHIEELKYVLPETQYQLVDGEMFSWYGSRMIEAPDYFLAVHKALKLQEVN